MYGGQHGDGLLSDVDAGKNLGGLGDTGEALIYFKIKFTTPGEI